MPFNFLDFQRCVLLNELINVHESAAHADLNLISFFNFDVHALLTKLVNTFGLPQEKNVHLLSFWVFIDEVSQCNIDIVILLWDVDGLVLLELFNLR